MSEWAPKRFWKTTNSVAVDGGYAIALDSRRVRTPAKAELVVPTLEMAHAIATEWDAQADKIDPTTMPVTRGANAAIDKVRTQKDEVVAMLAEYGGSDLLCYRATSPNELVTRQSDGWDPVLEWAANTLNTPLITTQGVIHVAQNTESLQRLHDQVALFDSFALAAVHDLISISGSLILALSVTHGSLSAQEAWKLSRIDEHWQIEQWGEDDEATAMEHVKEAAFLGAARFYRMSFT